MTKLVCVLTQYYGGKIIWTLAARSFWANFQWQVCFLPQHIINQITLSFLTRSVSSADCDSLENRSFWAIIHLKKKIFNPYLQNQYPFKRYKTDISRTNLFLLVLKGQQSLSIQSIIIFWYNRCVTKRACQHVLLSFQIVYIYIFTRLILSI